MKKLLINGCSMVAGDAISWHNYYPDVDWNDYISVRKSHPVYTHDEITKMYVKYAFELRRLENLGGQLGKNLGFEVVDLSEDGNSNHNICMTTISYLSELSPEERKNYHVFIGWTEITRRLISDKGVYSNITIGHLSLPSFKHLNNYIKETIINRSDIDHLLDYFHNVISLQNYLKANNISYTFWNPLISIENIMYLVELLEQNKHPVNPYKHKLHFDRKDWITFGEEHPWLATETGTLWMRNRNTCLISETNMHPNLETITEFSKKVAEHIRTAILS